MVVTNRPISLTVPVTPPALMKSPHLERAQDDDEAAGREIGQQPRPGHADGHTDGGDQGGKGGGLHPEITEDADYQKDIEGYGDERADVAQHGRIGLLPLQRTLHHAHRRSDQPAADHPEGNGGEDLHTETGGVVHAQVHQALRLLDGQVVEADFFHGQAPAE